MGVVRDTFNALTGKTGAEAAKAGGKIQAQAAERGIGEVKDITQQALGFLQPYQAIGEAGLGGLDFLTSPETQYQFLQNNPLFKSALEAANTQTEAQAAARGRLSAGDTLQQLSKNVLLAASPLISQQTSNIRDLLNLGTGIAGSEANLTAAQAPSIVDLITGGAAAKAAGKVGAANARTQGFQNLLTTGLTAGAIFSDKRLKKNIKHVGKINGHNIYSWNWNDLAKKLFGLIGSGHGVLAQEINETNPEAVIYDRGYLKVDYSVLGIL